MTVRCSMSQVVWCAVCPSSGDVLGLASSNIDQQFSSDTWCCLLDSYAVRLRFPKNCMAMCTAAILLPSFCRLRFFLVKVLRFARGCLFIVRAGGEELFALPLTEYPDLEKTKKVHLNRTL